MQLFKITFDLPLSKVVVLVYDEDKDFAISTAQKRLTIDKQPTSVVEVPLIAGIVHMEQTTVPRYED